MEPETRPEPLRATSTTNGTRPIPTTNAKSDVEMVEPTAAAAAPSAPLNPIQWSPSTSLSTNPTAYHGAIIPMEPIPAGATSVQAPMAATSTPPLSAAQPPTAVGRQPAAQAPSPGTSALQAATAALDTSVSYPPHGVQTLRRSETSTPSPQLQARTLSPLSQPRSASYVVSTDPLPGVSRMAASSPPMDSAPNTMPRGPPPNTNGMRMAGNSPHQGHNPYGPLPNIGGMRMTSHSPHQSHSGQFPHTATPPVERGAHAQLDQFRSPNHLAAHPYTAENIFSGGGYHLPDSSDALIPPSEYVDQCNQLSALVRNCHPSVVRRVVRDTWQTSLSGPEAHLSFSLNVLIDKCSGQSAKVAIGNFGKDLVRDARWEILSHFTPSFLAEMEDEIVGKAPDSLLDKGMLKRLNTIPAKDLLNMLARAERLGYDAGDIVGASVSKPPTSTYPSQTQTHTQTQTRNLSGHPSPVPPVRGGQGTASPRPIGDADDPTTCPFCHKRYNSVVIREHHVRKRVCLKPAAASVALMCPHCDQAFATPSGVDYHKKNNVCGENLIGPSRVPMPITSPTPASAATASPILVASSSENSPAPYMPTQPPSTQPQHAGRNPPMGTQVPTNLQNISSTVVPPPSQPRTTPIQPPQPAQGKGWPSPNPPETTAAALTSPAYDPYAHLSEENLASMNKELSVAEEAYSIKMRDAQRMIPDPVAMSRKLNSLKNSFATKQSIIRKKYGVRLRDRRGRAELEEERLRMTGIPSPSQSSYGHAAAEERASKKARVSMGGQSMTTQSQASTWGSPARKHAASTDVAAPASGGLMASAATPEMMAPTKVGRPSLGRPGGHGGPPPYRVASNGSPYQWRPPKSQATTATKASSNGPTVLPTAADLGSGSDTDSDSDVDTIPAQLPPPPPRAGQSFSRPAV